jgi:hypothetical protein
MAKKDAASKRLVEEIALAKRIKKAREETPKKVPEEPPRDLDGLLTRPLDASRMSGNSGGIFRSRLPSK